MPENEIESTLQFDAGLDKSNKLYRDRFVFPEVLAGVYKDNDAIVEALEAAVDHEIREKRINNISDEVILKNAVGPFYEDFSVEEKRILTSIVSEMRNEKMEKEQGEPLGSGSNRKSVVFGDNLQKAVKDAEVLLKEEAGRAGIAKEVIRETSGEVKLAGDGAAMEGRIIFDEDGDDDLEK